jgi:hypothetical protein
MMPKNADAQIGSVAVGRAWVASSVLAGTVAGPDGRAGTTDDKSIFGAGVTNNPAIVSRVGNVTIGGDVMVTAGTGHFGIVGQEIGSVRVGGQALRFMPGPGNDLAGLTIGSAGDVTIREVTM